VKNSYFINEEAGIKVLLSVNLIILYIFFFVSNTISQTNLKYKEIGTIKGGYIDLRSQQTRPINIHIEILYVDFKNTFEVTFTPLTVTRGGDVIVGSIGFEKCEKLIENLKKAIGEWPQVCKINRIETTKEIFPYSDGNYIKFDFKSINQGRVTDVWLWLVNGNTNYVFSLNKDQVKKLISILGNVPQEIKNLTSQEDKTQLLK
jgi:hypothetical protein